MRKSERDSEKDAGGQTDRQIETEKKKMVKTHRTTCNEPERRRTRARKGHCGYCLPSQNVDTVTAGDGRVEMVSNQKGFDVDELPYNRVSSPS